MKQLLPILLFLLFVSPIHAAIVINEFLPNPSGSSSEDNEWIELYNNGSTDVDISGWKLDDIDGGGTSPYTISSSAVTAGGFLVYEKSQTNIGLNNTNDTVRLLDNNNNIIDSYSYTSTTEDVSYGRTSDGGGVWVLCQILTRGISNVCSSPTPTPTQTPIPNPTSTPSPTPTKTPTPSPTQAPGPTNTPTNTPIPSKTPTPTPLKSSPTPTKALSTTLSSTREPLASQTQSGDILSGSTTSGNTVSDTEKQKKSFKPLIFSLLFIGIGCGLLVFVYYFKKGFPFKKDHDQL